MARRRPLVRAAGKNQQIPVGDALALAGALDEAPIVTLASAATVAIGAAQANTINISGTATITAFDTIAPGARRTLRFSGALTLTYDATKLILPRAANITTVAGDVADFVSLGSGNWVCIGYERATAASAKGDLGLVKGDVGLGNVDNTSDSNKPISSATQSALNSKAPLTSPAFSNGLTVARSSTTDSVEIIFNGLPGSYRYFRFLSSGSIRWDFGVSNAQESGNNVGSDFYLNRFSDSNAFIDSPWGISRSTGETRMSRLSVSGAVKPGQFTIATLPSASALSGYEIDVTDASGGPKRCRSDGNSWKILNTTTTVS